MITKQNFFLIIIAILGSIIITLQCTSNNKSNKDIIKVEGKKYEVIKHVVDTVEITKNKIIYKKGKDIYRDTIIYVSIPQHIDTLSILKKYYAKHVYKDILTLPDSLGIVKLTDTIAENKILGRKWEANVKQRVITDTKIVKELPRNQIYTGIGGLVGNANVLFGPTLTLKTKKDNIYGMNIYVDPNLNKYIGVNLAWKIKLKK